MRAGLRAWRKGAAARARATRLRHTAQQLRNPAAGRAWRAWAARARARRDAHALVRRALLGWLLASLGAALRGWAEGAARRARAKQLARKVWSCRRP